MLYLYMKGPSKKSSMVFLSLLLYHGI
ncbi:hypothetical protein MTR67_041045 [Solanum verrucosum]|uniref:Uncharacterized protein n=1 Tax=Solanum verrucosum TaxID=315347 RepID=A0AAF0ZSB4_SOLVR|nr:hypothetical protein MTR67_019620 [Solanum verrucosum]WMV47660.1 hypothetical protein MTR67_041045 [Solanum verrucosum]